MAIPLERLQGKYEILEKLTEGGMGAIYKVRHRLLEEIRVIKVMRPQIERDQTLEARFLREAKTAIRLRHQSIAQLYDFSMDDAGNAFIVMEYIDGLTLEEILRQTAPSIGLTLEIAAQSLDALAYLDRKGIVHRDISPDNLMLTRNEDGEPQIKLIDLGIAKSLKGGRNLTTTGLFLGKVRYCSPEQLRREEDAPVDHRSDLYSFGVVLYELLTGRHPIVGESLTALIAGHLIHPPIPFSETDPENKVPEDLRTTVLRALAKSPDERQDDAGCFARDIEALQARFPFTPEELDWALSQSEPPTTAIRIAPPGSTQDRLDVQFGALETPHPAALTGDLAPSVVMPTQAGPSETAVPPPLPPHPEVEVLLAEAQRLLEAGRPNEALTAARAALELEPDNEAAQQLSEAAEADRQQREEAARAAAIARTLDALGEKLDRGELASARVDIEEAQGALGGRTDFKRLCERLQELELDEAREQAESFRREAVALAGENRFGEARDRLRAAVELHPDPDAVREDIERLDQEREAWDARHAHARRVEEAVSEVQALLESGDLDGADGCLATAMEDLGEDESFTVAGARLERAREAAREQRLAELLRVARVAAERAGYDEAVEALEQAAALCPEDALVRRILRKTREEQARAEEEQRRAREQARAVEEAETLAEEGRFDEALERVAAAQALLGNTDVLKSARARIETGQNEQRQREQTEALLCRADERLEYEDLAGVLELVAEARSFGGNDPELAARAAELERTAEKGLTRARMAQEEEAAAARVEGCLERGDLEEARRALALAAKLFPASESLSSLQTRLAEAEEDLQLARIAELVGQAREAAEAGRSEQAVHILKRAKAIDPDSPEVAHSLDAIRRREAEEAIEAKLESGDLKGAERGLALAEKLYGEDDRFHQLRERLQRLLE